MVSQGLSGGDLGVWMTKAVGRSIFGRIYGFDHGPGTVLAIDENGKLLCQALATSKYFHIFPKELEKLQELTEMEAIAWAAK